MNEYGKREYLNFLFHGIIRELSLYDISSSQKGHIIKLFNRISNSENILRDTYLLTHVKDLSNLGKYITFIFKKTDDGIINFDNLMQNIESDKGYIKKELLNYLLNPVLKKDLEVEAEAEEERLLTDTSDSGEEESDKIEMEEKIFGQQKSESETEEEKEILSFRKEYLELIKSDEPEEVVFELPAFNESDDSAFELPSEEDTQSKGIPDIKNTAEENFVIENPESEGTTVFENDAEESAGEQETESALLSEESENDKSVIKESAGLTTDTETETKDREDEKTKQSFSGFNIDPDSSFVIKRVIKSGETTDESKPEGEEKPEQKQEEIIESKNSDEDRIELGEEIQEDINMFEKGMYKEENEEEEQGEEELQPTNAEFVEFEKEVKEINYTLKNDFDIMIYLVNVKPDDEDERNSIIVNILEATAYMEKLSKKMMFELISSIYQTINLSFEKISDGKYDITESTLNLFKKGLGLIQSLLKGDDYFRYDEILKSIENIRKKLLEEKEKTEAFKKHLTEKQELESRLTNKYPEDEQKIKLTMLKNLIIDTEKKLGMIDKISGEYQIYEALRSLSTSLNNFKESVKLSTELGMKNMSKLSEASYIFIKFLQNYRINPVTKDIREIFEYIIFCMKSIIMEKPPEDIDIFISYLNDPVKIFSNKEKENS